MKITVSQLRKIIREEVERNLGEGDLKDDLARLALKYQVPRSRVGENMYGFYLEEKEQADKLKDELASLGHKASIEKNGPRFLVKVKT